ncbi:hypothetical protein PA598K_06877 [Paenibacillus sp. 598K]|uniref:hypothetical protein n=1 Tax=Paenibacillus sp. 598K TaxID=1117987 RepID=UPI000FF974A9|nr:hypothetical protein [Paenibacillus sp. 598K]GBF78259.1 hypothetical protein PA598K_06877 [Paenibacillus sp. 598K]
MAKKKSFTLKFICTEDRTDQIIKTLAKREIQKVLDNMGVVSNNLDAVLDKYIALSPRRRKRELEIQNVHPT